MLSPHPAETLTEKKGEEILANAAALRAAYPDAEPMAFWDFDGTLFQGDCSEGFLSGGGSHVPGLAECAMQAGWSRLYSADGGFSRFWRDYQEMMVKDSQEAAYVYLVKIFAGAPAQALKQMAAREFNDRLRPWFFREALELWQQLEAGGVRCMVISASADFFIKGAADVLGVPEDRLHGLRLATNADGILTDQPVEPVTIGQGKAALLREVLAMTKQSHAVAAFGNDFVSDGPMLEAVASAKLPAGTPFAALVNQPLPAHYSGAVRRIAFASRHSS